MIFGTMNGQEPAAALLAGLGRPQLGSGLSDAQLGDAADVASTLLKWFISGATWTADRCKQVQSMLASVPGGWKTIETALKAIPGTSFTPSGTTVAYWIAETNRQTCARLGVDIMQAPTQTPAPTSTTDFSKLLSVVKASVAPIVQSLAPTSTTPATQTYPAGTIYAFSSKLAKYRIAVPRTTAGFGIATIEPGFLVPTSGLGADAAYQEVTPSDAAPAGGIPTTETDLEKKTGQLPLYKNWMFWAAVGGGVVVLGGIIALISRGSDRHARDQQFARGGFGFDDDDLEHDVIDVEDGR